MKRRFEILSANFKIFILLAKNSNIIILLCVSRIDEDAKLFDKWVFFILIVLR